MNATQDGTRRATRDETGKHDKTNMPRHPVSKAWGTSNETPHETTRREADETTGEG